MTNPTMRITNARMNNTISIDFNRSYIVPHGPYISTAMILRHDTDIDNSMPNMPNFIHSAFTFILKPRSFEIIKKMDEWST